VKEAGAKALNGERAFSYLERIWARPTLEVHGIVGGFIGAGAKTVIPAEATAKISIRLVPEQRAKEVAKAFEKAVKRYAPRWADVKVTISAASDPVQTPIDAWPFEVLDQAYREVWKRGLSYTRSGGSIPIVPLLQQRKAPVLLTGIGLPDDGLHSPNEKLTLSQLWKGIVFFGRYFEMLAAHR
jgi:acetylornithine deacetylase/succinyl-diaminopimelate desuccinylase-like protein